MSIEPSISLYPFFENRFFADKKYIRHSDIDLFLNLSITSILNYPMLLSEEDNIYINDNFSQNYANYKEIQKKKIEEIKQLRASGQPNQHSYNLTKKKDNKNSILTFKFPEFEIYFVAKLYVNGIAIEPEYTTKIVFSRDINLPISFRYKYKDLTPDSLIKISIYSVQLPEQKSLLGSTIIFLFDENYYLTQGKHAYKITPAEDIDVSTLKVTPKTNFTEEEMTDKEIDSLVFSYNKTQSQNAKTYTILKDEQDINFLNYFLYNSKDDRIEEKDDYLINFESKLNYLLTNTKSSFVEIEFTLFDVPTIYDEEVSDYYHKALKKIDTKMKNISIVSSNWICDPKIQKGKGRKEYLSTDNPITEKFSTLFRIEDDVFAKDLRPTPAESERIDELLNTPDFIKLEDRDIILFWKYRYELLKTNKKYALTKILNSARWGDPKSENEIIKNILYNWKTVEVCDILYMLSTKFNCNPKYQANDKTKENAKPKTNGLKEVRKYAAGKLDGLADEEINFILLQLVQALRYEDENNSPLKELLIKRCSKNIELATNFYWFLEVESKPAEQKNGQKKEESETEKYYSNIFDQFMQDIQPSVLQKITSQINLKKNLVDITKNELSKEPKASGKEKRLKALLEQGEYADKMNHEFSFPLDPRLEINGVRSVTVFKSALCPVKYAFNVTPSTQAYSKKEDKGKFEVMFKYGDDLRQDQLILQIFNYMDQLLKKVHQDYEFTIYRVLATSKTDGFVEFVPNSKTIFSIKKDYPGAISDFLRAQAKDNEKEYKKRLASFINTCAGYCVVTYLLGIGDRHLENLLIDKNGRLFHIDFGFILDKDPKPFPPPMKFCGEMLDAMGGKNSEGYKEFKNKCVSAYWILRENSRLIVNMFYLMIDSGIPELNNIEALNKLFNKFAPGMNKEQAKNSLISKLEDSLSSVASGMMEKFHEFAVMWR